VLAERKPGALAEDKQRRRGGLVMEKEIKHYDSKELKLRIRGKYPAPAWVVLEELREWDEE
jgi:hypothetical protein